MAPAVGRAHKKVHQPHQLPCRRVGHNGAGAEQTVTWAISAGQHGRCSAHMSYSSPVAADDMLRKIYQKRPERATPPRSAGSRPEDSDEPYLHYCIYQLHHAHPQWHWLLGGEALMFLQLGYYGNVPFIGSLRTGNANPVLPPQNTLGSTSKAQHRSLFARASLHLYLAERRRQQEDVHITK
jgi:hypothetical protein